MNHYSYTRRLKASGMRRRYRDGNRQPETYFNPEELAFLNPIGLKEMDVYDFAEDYVRMLNRFESFHRFGSPQRLFSFCSERTILQSGS